MKFSIYKRISHILILESLFPIEKQQQQNNAWKEKKQSHTMEMSPKKERPGAWLLGEVLSPRLAPVQQSTQVHP